jgi:hypothetical protein
MNLKQSLRYVNETRSKKAIPILITPVTRRNFDSVGKIKETHPIMQTGSAVAQESNTPLIDLDEKSKALLQQYGEENSKFLFNYLDPNEHPNYPDGQKDNTHFSELGARKMAELVLAEIKSLHLELADRIVKRINEKLVSFLITCFSCSIKESATNLPSKFVVAQDGTQQYGLFSWIVTLLQIRRLKSISRSSVATARKNCIPPLQSGFAYR